MNIIETIKALLDVLLGVDWKTGTLLVLILAKFIPNVKIGNFAEGLGNTITLGCSKYKWYKKFELWVIDGLAVFSTRFIKGLSHDN